MSSFMIPAVKKIAELKSQFFVSLKNPTYMCAIVCKGLSKTGLHLVCIVTNAYCHKE